MEMMPREPGGEIKRDHCSPGVISALAFCSGELCCNPAAAQGAELITFCRGGHMGSPAPASWAPAAASRVVLWQLRFAMTW